MRLLAVAGSPADAEFACGGTLVRVRKNGGSTGICTVANGNSTGQGVPPRELASARRQEAEKAAAVLAADLFWLDHSDFAVSNDAVTRVKLAEIMRAFRPDVVLAPAPIGPSQDARHAWPLAAEAAGMAAVSNLRTEQPALEAAPYLLAYQPGWAAGFVPTEYVDISATLDSKLQALRAYASLIEWRRAGDGVDLVEAVTAVSAYRGLQAGVRFAEAFRCEAGVVRAPTGRLLP